MIELRDRDEGNLYRHHHEPHDSQEDDVTPAPSAKDQAVSGEAREKDHQQRGGYRDFERRHQRVE